MHLGLVQKIHLITGLVALLTSLPIWWLSELSLWQNAGITLLMLVVALWLTHLLSASIKAGLAALDLGLLNLKDGEFATTLGYQGNDELGRLCSLYNQTALQLRAEKQWLYQRELMLDKVLQSSPQALLLTNSNNQVVFSNLAARDLFGQKDKLEGLSFSSLLEQAQAGLRNVLQSQRDGLFSIVAENQETQTWHLAIGEFLLNNQQHHLYILKQMTRELSRQEVMVWKKVIRIISHELNNSLGPISSMLHSGKILTERFDEPRMARVFATIDERIAHLTEFVQGYGKFAKLPEPKLSTFAWHDFVGTIAEQWPCKQHAMHNLKVTADKIQLEQMLINLLKNAHESGSNPDEVCVNAFIKHKELIIEVLDRGKGMTEQVMTNALVPFYSTKASGSGLGLALCREIAEAHSGHIALFNREGGGLGVRVALPCL